MKYYHEFREPDHLPALHASSAYRYAACPASAWVELEIPAAEPTVAGIAEMGTLAHRAVAGLLLRQVEPENARHEKWPELRLDGPTCELVRLFAAKITTALVAMEKLGGGMSGFEIQLAPRWGWTGTTDYICNCVPYGGILYDFKFGFLDVPPAGENWQLRIYVALNGLPVTARILSRAGESAPCVFDMDAVMDAQREAQTLRKYIEDHPTTFAEGDHCRYCPALGRPDLCECCARAGNPDALPAVPEDRALVNLEDLGRWLVAWQVLKKRGAAIEKLAKESLAAGVPIPGPGGRKWILKQSPPMREVQDTMAAYHALAPLLGPDPGTEMLKVCKVSLGAVADRVYAIGKAIDPTYTQTRAKKDANAVLAKVVVQKAKAPALALEGADEEDSDGN